MKKRQNGNLSNFFVEIIFVILFFSLAAVILTKIFVSSAYNNQLNRLRIESINSASSLLEVYKSVDNVEQCLKQVLDNEVSYTKDNNEYIVRLDDNMRYVKNGKIQLKIIEKTNKTKAGLCKELSLKYIYNNVEVYVIEGKKYEEK